MIFAESPALKEPFIKGSFFFVRKKYSFHYENKCLKGDLTMGLDNKNELIVYTIAVLATGGLILPFILMREGRKNRRNKKLMK